MKKQKVIARFIMEVLGSPKENVENVLKEIIEKLANEKEMKVLNKVIYDAEEQENKLWSTFAEIEIELPDFKRLTEVCFDYTPSSIEIIEPAGMELDSKDIQDFLNDNIARIHKYAMVIKNFQANTIVLQRELQETKNKLAEKE